LIGAGFFAQHHIEGWKRIPGVEIVALADPDEERARPFAKKWGIARTFPSAQELLREERVDFLDVVTRPETHLDLVTIAAGRGVHVLCQKPMAPTLVECLGMVETCARANVRLLIHENWRWQPWYREIRRLLDSGEVGAPRRLEFVMRTGDGRGPEAYRAQPYFRKMPRLLLYETAVHFLDTIRFLAGEATALRCEMGRKNPAIVGEDWARVEISLAGGATAGIDADRTDGPMTPPLTMATFRLVGEKGRVRLLDDGRILVAEKEHAYAWSREGYRGDSVKATLEHLVDGLRSGRPCETEGREYVRTVALVEACYRSAKEKVQVRIT
jgi:predicted dehydrogenase